MTAPILISVFSLLVSVSAIFFCRWYIKRKTTATRLLADYRDEVGRLIAEIDSATDRDSLLVEERIKILRKLLEDTDRRIATYIRELQRSRSGEAMYATLGRGIRAALDSRQPSQDQPSLTAEFQDESLAEPEYPEMSIPEAEPRGEIAVPVPADGNSRDAAEAGAPDKSAKSRLKVQIADMSARGMSPQEIASKLGISTAEVDLALNLLSG